jgi:hypothetical protein
MPHVAAVSRFPVTVDINEIDITEGDWILPARLHDELTTVRKFSETKQDFQLKTKNFIES